MKKAPVKILIIILITGLICIMGEVILSKQLDNVGDSHRNIMKVSVKNREYMENIKTSLYRHQAILANYALADSEEAQSAYLELEGVLREQLTKDIIDFSYRMKNGERERIYHRVYSDFSGYEENTKLYLDFIRNGEQDMALYYNNNVLKGYLDSMNSRLDDLDLLTIQEISTEEEALQESISRSMIVRYAIFAIALVFIALCIYLCVKITYGLDKYKEELESQLTEKNRVLQERNEKMIMLQDGIIISMANLIESRNGETGEHVKRTSAYVEMLARETRRQGHYTDVLTDEYIERLMKVAPLHDVGKIAVPDQILLKPGKLTTEEFEQIKLHAPKGGEIIREFFEHLEDKEYVRMAIDVAGYHHEKWNGEGYTKHLKEQEIPLSARIMAVADVFDALISKRCYKDAFSFDKAFGIMEESAGSHFDPVLIEVFVSMRRELEAYVSENSE